jgi:hypothetical protein
MTISTTNPDGTTSVTGTGAVTPANTPGTPGYNPNGGAPLPSAPTISSLYGGESDSDKSIDAATGVYATQATTPVDEAAIRAGVTSQLQTEIDATNSIYDQKLNEAKIAGANNVGSTNAINARRGLGGSDFGNAIQADTASKNNDVYSGIGNERAAALASITNAGNTEAQQEIADKNTAKQQSATDYINFLSQQDSRKTARTSNAASQALAAGIDLTDPSSADVKSIASSYNIDPAALVSSFVSAKNAQAAATKANLVSAPVTDNVYQPGAGGALKQVQTGTATPDSNLKEYQAAVAQGYTGSITDFLGEKANLKTSVGIQTKAPGTLEGVLDVRQDLDAAYENARGKLAYGSDKIAPLDEIHQQARDALNQYLQDHAQNTEVKAALRSQSLLFRADDVLRDKASQEGGSVLQRVQSGIKNHPLASVAGAAGTTVAAFEGGKRLLTGSF